MQATFEITDRFIERGNANSLLYTPLESTMSYQQTRRYEFDYSGDATELEAFVSRVLCDPISQELHQGDAPAVSDSQFALDYGMKPGALDLEKEMIAAHYASSENANFELHSLKIRHRIYVFPGEPGAVADPQRFVKDICNGAVHNWTVITG